MQIKKDRAPQRVALVLARELFRRFSDSSDKYSSHICAIRRVIFETQKEMVLAQLANHQVQLPPDIWFSDLLGELLIGKHGRKSAYNNILSAKIAKI